MLAIYKRKTNTRNYATGEIVQDYDVYINRKPILISKRGTLFKNNSAYKNFGANTDTYDLEVLVDVGDLEINKNDIIYYGDFKYSVVEAGRHQDKYLLQLKGLSDTDIFNTEVNSLINNGWNANLLDRVSVDKLIYDLKNNIFDNVLPSNVRLLPFCGKTIDDASYVINGSFFDVSSFDSYDYKNYGMYSGIYNVDKTVDTTINPNDLYKPNDFCFAFNARHLDTEGTVIDYETISLTDYTILGVELPLTTHGCLVVNFNANISVYFDGVLIDQSPNVLTVLPDQNILLNSLVSLGFFLTSDAVESPVLLSNYVTDFCARLGR